MTDEGELAGDESEVQMRVGLGHFTRPTEARLRFARQLGVEVVVVNAPPYLSPEQGASGHLPPDQHDLDMVPLSPSGERLTVEGLTALVERLDEHGLELAAIENPMPMPFMEKIILGDDGCEEQLANFRESIRAAGKADVPILGYHFMADHVARTHTEQLRGGAVGTAFDAAELGPPARDHTYSEAELWENYERFLQAVLPVAEEADVTLALHPHDPPTPTPIDGLPNLFRDFASFRRAMDLVESDHHGLEFCLGNWSAMGEDLAEVIRYFGARDRISYVHFRDVVGTVPSFHETFVDEGNYDAYEVMSLLADVGFSGVMIPDHVPEIDDDGDWPERGRAHAVGYLQGVLEGVRHRQAER